jgi:Zn-dependent protease/CBS domain-containing protein
VSGFRIGSIAGIEIRIDYTWFVIFALILWTLTRSVFPATYPSLPSLTYLVMGAVGTLLFFASLLAHELSHSVVARSRGIAVESITLFIFGGMARTKDEFETPGDEFLIAIAGPVMSMAIAGFFWLLTWAATQTGASVAVSGVASYLALINIVLAVFNLFPGFPLDGGRLLRAIVWKRTGDLRRATRIASNGGKVFGYMLMVLGLLNLFGGNPLGGMWLVFIGWFVRMAAETSYVQHVLRSSLEGATARDAMTPAPQTVTPDETLQDFLDDYVLDGRHHSYPIVQDARPLGLITLDRVRALPKDEWRSRTVRDAMVPLSPDIAVAPGDDLIEVVRKLNASRLGRVLVTHEDRLVGIISQSDIARWLERARLREQVADNGPGKTLTHG